MLKTKITAPWYLSGWILFFLAGYSIGLATPANTSSAPQTPSPMVPATQVPPIKQMPPTAAPRTILPAVHPTATATTVISYTAYRVQEGDTLESIGREGGTTPDLLRSYNRLSGTPQLGREIIIPQLSGMQRSLPNRSLLVLSGNTTRPWVALTFDCGGLNSRIATLLDTLKEHNTHVTFFLHGDSIAKSPDLLRRMVNEGHELANHSYSHPDFTGLTEQKIADELERTETLIQKIAGPQITTRPYFRFPYGAYNPKVLQTVIDNGYLPIHWTLDSLDSIGKPKTAKFIAERVTHHLPREQLSGAIILAHCVNATIDAVPSILQTFEQEGIEVRTLTDVLGP